MKPVGECTEEIARAERHVIRCAMGIVNAEGWSFEKRGQDDVVIFPEAMRRLEGAIARLREARKAAKKHR